MLQLERLNPNQRLVVESPVNRFKLMGPGRVVLNFRQRILARVYIGPKAQSIHIKAVRTAEGILMDATVQVIYRVDPALLSPELLPRVAGLNEKGWHGALHWQAEYVLRMLMIQYSWRDLPHEDIQKRLERQFTQTLADRLKRLGLNVLGVCLVKTELPIGLQKSLVQAERDKIEAQSRAGILQNYFEIFGNTLSNAMPYIIQWELMNTVHKNGDPKILFTAAGLTPEKSILPLNDTTRSPAFSMQLPLQ